MAKVQERLAVLSLNIFCRPEGIHSGQWFKTGDYKDLRVALLLRKMTKFDVVILQEMFEAGPRQKRFVREAYAMGFRYHCGSVWPRLLDSRLIDGGLLILSRYPIVERDQLAYSQGAGSDGICAKGVLYARIQLSPDLSDSLHVFTTHTQAGDNYKDYSIRLAQIQEMHRFVARTIRDDPGVPVLITGDFNLDARHDLVHDSQTGLVTSTRCRESKVYQQLVADFERVVREARLNFARVAGKTVDADNTAESLMIDLMKRCDTTKLGDEIHPITNGDGHSLLFHKTDPLSLEKDGKCIDYMFFCPGINDQTTPPVSATTSTDSTNGDGGSASVESVVSPRFRLTLVEKGTTVDHCSVNELTEDENYSDVGDRSPLRRLLPISHLSDHYGLRAIFLLETSSLEHPDGTPVSMNESLASVLQLYFPQHAFAQQPRRLWKWKLAFALLAIVASAGGVTLILVRTALSIVLR
ncbi:Endonuclease/Exonuclease/phosphatase family [Phytophthora infestans]|uniref:sphingomyelin phosphodiesterase n=1 Tax=Phytophthora infestans TaxID=4787 RepID=A0A833T352_PHYIN|nr:Endonuclease/Exonuclease/phosphatase family [Phytophthora infestans]KAF4146244.1 Endonuclease/Exonuclease/phosphatase family [Phytophthora infestans]